MHHKFPHVFSNVQSKHGIFNSVALSPIILLYAFSFNPNSCCFREAMAVLMTPIPSLSPVRSHGALVTNTTFFVIIMQIDYSTFFFYVLKYSNNLVSLVPTSFI